MLAFMLKSVSDEVIPRQTTASQVLYTAIGLFESFFSEFAEQINVGAAKGWVRYLKEKDLSDELSSVVEDGWLRLSVRITLVSHMGFRNALPPILKRLPAHRLPKIDSRTKVRHQGTNRFLTTAITFDRLPFGRGLWIVR